MPRSNATDFPFHMTLYLYDQSQAECDGGETIRYCSFRRTQPVHSSPTGEYIVLTPTVNWVVLHSPHHITSLFIKHCLSHSSPCLILFKRLCLYKWNLMSCTSESVLTSSGLSLCNITSNARCIDQQTWCSYASFSLWISWLMMYLVQLILSQFDQFTASLVNFEVLKIRKFKRKLLAYILGSGHEAWLNQDSERCACKYLRIQGSAIPRGCNFFSWAKWDTS